MAKVVTTLTKKVNESRLFDMSFANKMRTGETIVSIDSVTSVPNDLTFDTEAFSDQVAQILISGGSTPARADDNNENYEVVFTVTTSSGQVLENTGILIVEE